MLLVLLALVCWPSQGWLATGFQQLLPVAEYSPWERRSTAASAARYERQLIFLVSGSDRVQAAAFAAGIEQRLRNAGFADPSFATEQAERWRRLGEHLRQWQPGLVTPGDSSLLRSDPEAYLASFRGLLYSPVGSAWLTGLPDDPLGLMRNFLDRPMSEVTGDLHGPLVLAQVPQDGLAFGRLGELYPLYRELKREAMDQGLELYASGAPLYTSYGVRSARLEVSSIGLVSLLTLAVLLVWALRSGRGLLLTLVSVAAGLLGGAAITVALQQQMHLLALVFGATLIGIAADYAFHYLCHSLLPGWTPADGLRPVLRGLMLSAASSSLAFLVLALLPFPGVRQIGIFMASGLAFALLTVCLLFPAFYRGYQGNGKRIGSLQSRIGSQRLPAALRLPLRLLLLFIAGLGLSNLNGVDEVRDFYAAPADLVADEAYFKDTMGIAGDSRHLLLQGQTVEALLQLEEHLLAQRPGLGLGLTALVPSAASQRANLEMQRELLARGLLQQHIVSLGLSPEVYDSLVDKLAEPYSPLVPADLEGLELPLGLGNFLGCDAEGCASLLSPGFDTLSMSLPAGVTLVDPVGRINSVMTEYRVAVAKMLLLSLLAAVLLLTLVLGWRRALTVVVVPASACLLSLAVVGLVDGEYTIIHLLALLLIVGVGLDYAIFRNITPAASQSATSLAITLSSLTSILAFGMLGLSRTPVISDFGQTIALGLMFAWLLSLPGEVTTPQELP